ncbi:hypothetical protein Ancab_028825 [Ancistrocladus abbreviatus]
MVTDDDCCNSCEEVREAYRKKGLAISNPDLIDQESVVKNHKDSPSSTIADAFGVSIHKNISTRSSVEGAMKDRLYVQLDQAMAEAQNSRWQFFEESNRRSRAENDTMEAMRKKTPKDKKVSLVIHGLVDKVSSFLVRCTWNHSEQPTLAEFLNID